MKLLKEKILNEVILSEGGIIKVDSFLNRQIDAALLSECAKEWKRRFANSEITKILTVEASGIAISCLAALHFGVPLVFARKIKVGAKQDDHYSAKVISYTHGRSYDISLPKEFISPSDKILIIDDLLSGASDLKAMINLVERAGATVVGAGVAIEKLYVGGGERIREMGYRVESLAKVVSVDDNKITLSDN